jgi:hypothetical protein
MFWQETARNREHQLIRKMIEATVKYLSVPIGWHKHLFSSSPKIIGLQRFQPGKLNTQPEVRRHHLIGLPQVADF